jgi:predicted transcriptional regulator
MSESGRPLRELVAEVAAAYFTHTIVEPQQVGQVMRSITESLIAAQPAEPAPPAPAERASPLTADQIRLSITPEALISFEDGRKYKLLRRHLRNRQLTPSQYRAKWGLPPDYPMVAPACSARRSATARRIHAPRAMLESLRA